MLSMAHSRSLMLCHQLMDLPGPRWKKGKDGKGFAALAAANPMSSIVAELQASLRESEAVAILSGQGGDAILGVTPEQAVLLNRAAFGRALENAGEERQWFQLGPEEVFFLFHALKCMQVESDLKKQMDEGKLWDHLTALSEPFPEMYKAYEHLRLKNWVVRSGLQYGADYVAYRHHPALVHSEFAVIVVPEGIAFGTRCGRLKVWSDLLCVLRASGSVAKTLLVLTISGRNCELSSPDCLEQLVVHERAITRWIPQQCREQRHKPCLQETNREEQEPTVENEHFVLWLLAKPSVGLEISSRQAFSVLERSRKLISGTLGDQHYSSILRKRGNLRGRSPLVRAPGMASGSSTLVRKAGEMLLKFQNTAELLLPDWSTTKFHKTEQDHVPAVELISVEQKQELMHRVSLPNPCSYTHGFTVLRRLEGELVMARSPEGLALLPATRGGKNQYLNDRLVDETLAAPENRQQHYESVSLLSLVLPGAVLLLQALGNPSISERWKPWALLDHSLH
ncbi:hypothetical protein ACP70R_043782 [Stipagrostis hirtigluma subsp. patula]